MPGFHPCQLLHGLHWTVPLFPHQQHVSGGWQAATETPARGHCESSPCVAWAAESPAPAAEPPRAVGGREAGKLNSFPFTHGGSCNRGVLAATASFACPASARPGACSW